MTTGFLTQPDDNVIELDDASGHHRPAHVIDRRSVVAVNAALATGRPLLVRGEPGVGKSQLARAAAVRLGRRFLQQAVDASTEPRDLLYTIDAVARLAAAQLLAALNTGSRADVSVDKFVRPGALWWAFDWEHAVDQERRADAAAAQVQLTGELVGASRDSTTADRGVVLLIDEIDKADSAIPNALLDALGRRRFDVPGCGTVEMRAGARPLVVITTNEERSLPDAFLRRCFVLHLELPDEEGESAVQEALQARGAAHFPRCDAAILAKAAKLIASQRLSLRREQLPAPGVAEYVDLIDAVLGQDGHGVDPAALLAEISEFVLHKHASPPAATPGRSP